MANAENKNGKGNELARIASKHLDVVTLEVRGRDSLDFYDLSVAGIKAALEAAYDAGRKSR